LNIIETQDGSPTLFSDQYKESFHSTFGAVTESRHVFLNASGVTERLSAGHATNVLEIGFGLGLNALLTCDLAIENNTELNFHSVENDPSICALIQEIDYSPHLRNGSMVKTLQEALQPVADCLVGSLDTESEVKAETEVEAATASMFGVNTNNSDSPNSLKAAVKISFTPTVTLYIHWSNAVADPLPSVQFDAVYLDAFSPDNNPECWTSEFFSKIRSAMNPEANMSTYCAKGSVRRSLLTSDFRVTKLAGPPGKREMMVATPNR